MLLALFAARIVLFLTVFGGLYSDLAHFVGLMGMSISLNGGIKRPLLASPPVAPVRVRMRIPVATPIPR